MISETPLSQPIVPAYQLRILSDEQLVHFKPATLEILEGVGVHCPSEEALGTHAEHEAQVDLDSQVVKLLPEGADLCAASYMHFERSSELWLRRIGRRSRSWSGLSKGRLPCCRRKRQVDYENTAASTIRGRTSAGT